MKNNDFEFNYSAPTNEERKEIESIRNSYLNKTKEISKLDLLRKLDNKVKNTPLVLALAIGILGALIFGLGMAMTLEWNLLIWGIVVSAVGVVSCALAYPFFKLSTKHMKAKYSSQILSLSEELLNSDIK